MKFSQNIYGKRHWTLKLLPAISITSRTEMNKTYFGELKWVDELDKWFIDINIGWIFWNVYFTFRVNYE